MVQNRELRANYQRFADRWKANYEQVTDSLATRDDLYFESYRRILSFQAWRSELFEHALLSEALAFFLEAQNDVLTSHVLAQFGMWRPSLQALRSCIENTLQALYYKDHPVELRLWDSARQRLTFSELQAYLSGHPDKPTRQNLIGLERLAVEYATLSKAVHASSRSFRMAGDNVRFFIDEQSHVGGWESRERRTLGALNLVLLWMFREQLTGARLPNLRRIIAYCVTATARTELRQHLGITIPAA